MLVIVNDLNVSGLPLSYKMTMILRLQIFLSIFKDSLTTYGVKVT